MAAVQSQQVALRSSGTSLTVGEPPGGDLTALEPVVSESARGPILVGILVFLLFFVGLGGWAALAPLDSAVLAQGVVKVEGNRQTMQHLDGGIVSEILVREGDRVEAGQVLIRLDDTTPRANVEVLTGQYDALKALEGRLVAERDRQSRIEFDPGLVARRQGDPNVDGLMASQENLFEARRRAMEGQVSVLKQRIAQLREQIKGFDSQARSQERQTVLVREELAGTRELQEKGHATKTRVLALERQVAYLEGTRGEQIASIARAHQAIGEAELQILQLERDRLTEVSDHLRDAQAKLYDIEPRLRAAKETLSRVELRAPMSGYVVGLTVFTVGGVIGRGDRVLDVVPVDAPLVVEGQIQPQDIEAIKIGMRSEVSLTAFKLRVVPQLHATVTKVSADRLVDQKTGAGYYLVTLEIDKKELEETKNVFLLPGMPADVMIPVEPRSALDYFLSPLTQSMGKSFREQ